MALTDIPAQPGSKESVLPTEFLLLEHFHSWDDNNNRPYHADFGTLATEKGASVVFCAPDVDFYERSGLYEGDKYDYMFIDSLRRRVKHALASPVGSFYSALGFNLETVVQDDESYTMASFPTTARLNSAMRDFQGASNQAPFVFAPIEDRYGGASGKEFIENLAEGRIIIATARPGGLERWQHDLGGHVPGYASLDADTFAAIQRRANKLVQENKLTTSLDGRLANKEAQDFARAVDLLSSDLTNLHDAVRPRYYIKQIHKHLRVIVGQSKFVKSERLYRKLRTHGERLTRRAEELALAA